MKIKYKDLVSRGFKRVELDCNVHCETFGYPSFVLAWEKDNITLEWSPVDRKCNFYLNNNLLAKNISIGQIEEIIASTPETKEEQPSKDGLSSDDEYIVIPIN